MKKSPKSVFRPWDDDEAESRTESSVYPRIKDEPTDEPTATDESFITDELNPSDDYARTFLNGRGGVRRRNPPEGSQGRGPRLLPKTETEVSPQFGPLVDGLALAYRGIHAR